MPAPPLRTSLPAPPLRVLAAALPVRVSLKLLPVRLSKPSSVSLPEPPVAWAVVTARLATTALAAKA
ncbi:hypothetical protein D3C80_1479930 [compost metagenome]